MRQIVDSQTSRSSADDTCWKFGKPSFLRIERWLEEWRAQRRQRFRGIPHLRMAETGFPATSQRLSNLENDENGREACLPSRSGADSSLSSRRHRRRVAGVGCGHPQFMASASVHARFIVRARLTSKEEVVSMMFENRYVLFSGTYRHPLSVSRFPLHFAPWELSRTRLVTYS